MFYVPKQIADRLTYRGEEHLGYLIGHKFSSGRDIFITNMTKPDRPDPYPVLRKFLDRKPLLTGMPYHIVSEKDMTPVDEYLISELVKNYEFHYYVLGLPLGPVFLHVFGDKGFPEHKVGLVEPATSMKKISHKINTQLSRLEVESFSI